MKQLLKKGGWVLVKNIPKIYPTYFICGICPDPSGQNKHKIVQKVAQKSFLLNSLFVFVQNFFLLFQFLSKILYKQTKIDFDYI